MSLTISYEQIREYMPTLLQSGVLTRTNNAGSLYKIRKRGLRFLELYGKVNEMIGRKKELGLSMPISF
jgi:predicted transcriptional regulator